MIKSKIFVIIFAICFVILMSAQYMRVAQYGLYGSKEMWEKTMSIPDDINSPSETALKNLLVQGENNGWIKCFPEQKICHYTGKGVYNYGAYSEYIQSSDYLGWLDLIIKSVIQSIVLALILTLLIDAGYLVLRKYNK